MSKFRKTLIFYILGIFVSNYPIEEATINVRDNFCGSGQWRCENGECILLEKRCDGEINCSDSSDEAPKVCSTGNLGISTNVCILPPYPRHGTYNATIGLKPGAAVLYSSLTYTCDEGYSLKGERHPICFMGVWVTVLPTCESHCKPLRSNTVNFKCYKQYSSFETSCNLPQDNNSRAKATCKESYQLQPPPKDLICTDGSWDYMPHCTPECGTLAPEGKQLVINGEVAKIGEFPWHVGLYDKTSTPITQICGGSIFSPNLVVTAAHCVYKDQAGLKPASSFAVAAGKFYRRWNSLEDEKYVQKIDVIKIEIPELYKGSINAYTADVAVLILKGSFVFSSFVRPVCISFDYSDNLNGQLGRVAGWGLTEENGSPSRTLQTVSLPIIRSQECFDNSPPRFRPLLLSDKICAGYTNGTALCSGDSGGGLVLARRNGNREHYYLYGIVSTSARNEELNSCSAFSYTAFTNLKVHQQWFQRICLLEWGCENGGCISLEQRCHKGIDYCLDRSDEAGFCFSLHSSTSKDMCILPVYPRHGTYNATIGNKPGDAVSHTSLSYTCDVGYRLKGEGSPSCVRGIWVAEVPTCEKIYEKDNKACGRVSSQSRESVFEKRITISGTDIKSVTIPWLVTLFAEKHGRSQCELTDAECWVHISDGSLISSKFVLTTAWFIPMFKQKKLKARAGDLDTFYEPYQERLITKIIVHPRFEDTTDFGPVYDVALLVLDSPYTSMDNIGFICLPPPDLNMTPAGCKVASWSSRGGVGDRQEFLQVADVNLLDQDQCEKTIRKNLDSFRLHDSFICAAFTLDRDSCGGGYAGSPLMCLSENHYYARGLTTWAESCRQKNLPAPYADVAKVRDWIDQEMRTVGFKTDTYTFA